MTGPLANWWSSIAFRQALIYAGLVVITMVVLLVIIYQQTVGIWQRRIDRQLEATTQRLLQYYDRNGADALAFHINGLLGDGVDSDTEVYALVAPDGHRIAGNLRSRAGMTPHAIHHRAYGCGAPTGPRKVAC